MTVGGLNLRHGVLMYDMWVLIYDRWGLNLWQVVFMTGGGLNL